ncbi:MAG TPA: thrombospondin type 3 repeat-containing protein [Luteolibacter sp.]|nr:thrombospondin type 3 repeat-containing protein [Luteolibacter sp.]
MVASLAAWAQAANDNFADATDVTGQTLPYYLYMPGTGTAEAGEPAHAGSPAAASVWLQWKAPADQAMAFGEYLNGGSSRIGIYTGTAVNALTLVAQGTGKVFFPSQAGVRYHIAVDTAAADYIYLRTYPAGGADAQADAHAIAGSLPLQVHGNNVFATASEGDPDFGVDHPANHSVWWVWTATFTGALRVDARRCDFGVGITILERPPGNAATRVSGGLDSAGFTVTAGNDYLICVDAYLGDPGEISLWLDQVPSGPPPNDNIANATDLGSSMVACDGGWLLLATPEAGMPNENLGYPQWGIPGDRTMWWKWQCPQSGDYRFSTLCSNLFAGLFLYTGTPEALTYVTSSPDMLDGVRITATAGTTYWIQVRDYRKVCSRAEINIHPALHEPAYFTQLKNRVIDRLMGSQRMPGSDPDGDGLSNDLELALGTNPQVRDPNNVLAPRLLPNGGGWMLRWGQDDNYIQYNANLPMTLLPKIANSPSGPWSTGTQTTDPATNLRSSNLPSGSAGFGRLEFNNPNWTLDP